MFPLKHKTRRVVCRLAFCALGLAPTACLLAWGVWQAGPNHRAAYENELTHELGMSVRIAGVHHPRPGVIVLEGLQALDKETGSLVLAAPILEVSRAESGWRVVASGKPRIAHAALDKLTDSLKRYLINRSTSATENIRLVVEGNLILSRAGRDEKWPLFECDIDSVKDGPRAVVRFRPPRCGGNAPIVLTIFRDRKANPAETGFELETGAARLPCSLAAPLWPAIERLGPRARFGGYLWAANKPRGWSVTATAAELVELDLEQMVSLVSPHILRGTAVCRITEAEFSEGRLMSAKGSIQAESGTIGADFLSAAAESLSPGSAGSAAPTAAPVPFKRLAAEFQVDVHGIRLTGKADAEGAIMVGRAERLLEQPTRQPWPIAALIQTLASDGGPTIPGNREADRLLDILPLPANPSRVERQARAP